MSGFGKKTNGKIEFFKLNGKTKTMQHSFKKNGATSYEKEDIDYIQGILTDIKLREKETDKGLKWVYEVVLEHAEPSTGETETYILETSEGANHTNSLLNQILSLSRVEDLYISAYTNKASVFSIYMAIGGREGQKLSWKYTYDQLPATPEIKDAAGNVIMQDGRALLDKSARNAFFRKEVTYWYANIFNGKAFLVYFHNQQPQAKNQQQTPPPPPPPAPPTSDPTKDLIAKLSQSETHADFCDKWRKLHDWAKSKNLLTEDAKKGLCEAINNRISGCQDAAYLPEIYQNFYKLIELIGMNPERRDALVKSADIAAGLFSPAQQVVCNGNELKLVVDDLPF